jgi:hypothetical protein
MGFLRFVLPVVIVAGCVSVPKHGRFAMVPPSPSSWSTPAFYIDGPNTSGCASDTNTCTSSTCGSSGIGPCLTTTGVRQKYGSQMPVFDGTLVGWYFLGNTIAGDCIAGFQPTTIHSGAFGLFGLYTQTSSGTLSTVTSKVRATPQLLQVTLSGAAPPVHGLIHNLTHPSRALVSAVNGATITLDQPLNAYAIGNVAGLIAEVDTWTAGDSYTIEQTPKICVQNIVHHAGDYSTNLSTQPFLSMTVQALELVATANTNASRIAIISDLNVFIFDSVVDSNELIIGQCNDQTVVSTVSNSYSNSIEAACTAIAGGNYGNVFLGQHSILMTDVVMNNLNAEIDTMMESTYLSGTLRCGSTNDYSPCQVDLRPFALPAPFLWGPGAVSLGAGSKIFNASGNSWASTLLVTGSLTLDGSSTACSVAAGTWTCGRSITAANLDTYTGLVQPTTGSAFATSN